MTVRRLRAIMARYGKFGVLFVAAYLLLHEGWRHRRFSLLLCIALIAGLIGCLLLLPERKTPRLPPTTPPPISTHAPVVPKVRPKWQPESKRAREKLEEAERKLARYKDTPPMSDYTDPSLSDAGENAVQASLDEEVSGRGYADMGNVLMRSYAYEDAAQQFTLALEIAPDAVEAKTGLERARHAQALYASIKKRLPSDQQIGRLFPFPMPERKLWAALTSEESKNGGFPERENVRLSVYEERGQQLTQVWHSEVIPSIDDRGYPHPDLWAFPMTGERIPELVFIGVCSGGSANPTLMHIYRWTGRTFHKVLEAYSGEQPLWIEDVRHTGRYQVRSVVYIGSSMGHSDSNHVRWPDLYDWNGRRFVEANAKFPEAFQKSRREILECLENSPEDPELLKYLGMTYLYEHRTRLAFATFDRMERACHKALQEDPSDPDSQIYQWRDLGDVLEMEGKRKEAIRCFRRVQHLCRECAKASPSDEEQYRSSEENATRRIRNLQRIR